MNVVTKSTVIALAGASGDLGTRIAKAVIERGATVRALVRAETSHEKRVALEVLGAEVTIVDERDATALTDACRGVSCVVSALNGLRSTIVEAQGRLLGAAVAAGAPRFIPSDFCLDYTHTRPGDNRNMDLRRECMLHLDRAEIRVTSILNGAFSDLLTGQAPIVLVKPAKIVYWGSADQELDFTSKDDVARYTASVALDASAPRFLRIAGDVVTPRSLARAMTTITGKRFGLLRPGGLGSLSAIIWIAKNLAPQPQAVFPPWQGMQYLRDMSSGNGKLRSLDNDRYGTLSWTSANDVLTIYARPA